MLTAAAVCLPLAVGLASSLAYVPFGRPYISARAGRGLFTSNCSQCHTVDEGGPSGLGPNLANIGRDAATRRPGMSATEYLVESITQPDAFQAPGPGRMPNVAHTLSDKNLRHIVAYLSALGGQVDHEAIALTDFDAARPPDSAATRNFDVDQAERGKRLFLGEGKCSECHTLKRTVESGLRAPPVRYMARHGDRYLRESIEDPSKVIAHTYKQHTIVTNDGVVHTGRIMRRDADRLLILTVDSAGRMRPISIRLEDVEVDDSGQPLRVASDVSVMPKLQLTPGQIDDLITFLTSATDLEQAN